MNDLSSKSRTAIVTTQGGMQCAYSAGALVALGKELNITTPDIVVAASGSVGGMFYYLSGQYDFIEKAWTTSLPSKQFIRYFPFPSLNIDYLVNTIFEEKYPLDIARFKTTLTEWNVPVVNFETGELTYLNKSSPFSPYEIMRAAKAIPVWYGKSVALGDQKYIDGGVGSDVHMLMTKAVLAGADTILCIGTPERKTTTLQKTFIQAYTLTLPKLLRDAWLKKLNTSSISNPPSIRLLTMFPSKPLLSTSITRDPTKITNTFLQGYNDVLARRSEIVQLLTT